MTRRVPMNAAIGVVLILASASNADVSFTATALEDAFARQFEPTLNYGSGGAVCVAGVDSVNAQGQPRGRFDPLLKFNAAGAVASFNTAFGAGNWTITSAQLQVVEVGAPTNDLFPRGAGSYTVAWFSDDNWTEGPGTPGAPAVGTGNQLTWNWLQTLLASATDTTLGTCASAGVDGLRVCSLATDSGFVSDVAAGGSVTLHMAPVTSTLGFTFNSANFGMASARPRLVLSAIPEPATGLLLAGACLTCLRRSRRKSR